MLINILHISDIHLENSEDAIVYGTQLVTDLKQRLKIERLNYLVVSGDVANVSQKSEYDAAMLLVEKLKMFFKIDEQRIIVVPGNHDLSWDISKKAYQNECLEDVGQHKKRFENFNDYFYKKIRCDLDYPYNYDEQGILHCYDDDKMLFLTLNSSWEIDHMECNREKAGINMVALSKALDNVMLGNYSDWLKIAVFHHPVNGLQMMNNEFMQLLAVQGFKLCMHGHIHRAQLNDFKYDYKRKIEIVGAGTFGAPAKDQVTGIPLQYNLLVYDTDKQVITVETRKKEDRHGAWSPDQRWPDPDNSENLLPRYFIFMDEQRKSEKTIREKLRYGTQKMYEDMRGSGGRFYHLDISTTILSGVKSELLEVKVTLNNEDKNSIPLNSTVKSLYQNECWHATLIGEGGRGKTVSLIKLWENFLSTDENLPIPIFIALNEYNDLKEDREKFILHKIIKDCMGKLNPTDKDENELWEYLKEPVAGNNMRLPSVVLLLDGFNEITVERQGLIKETKKIIQQLKGIQIIITSRYDFRQNLSWDFFNKLELMELEDGQIESYLKGKGKEQEKGLRLLKVLRNPMMLTLYCASCSFMDNHIHNSLFGWKKDANTSGEILWNFIESHLAKKLEESNREEEVYYYGLILKFLVPHIGWMMENKGVFYFSSKDLQEAVNCACENIGKDDFYRTFSDYAACGEELCLERKSVKLEINRFKKVEDLLLNELRLMVKEKDDYRFLHQNFRDYFAAVHLLNEIQISLVVGILPNVMKESPISFYVGKYMGEIEGEHYNVPVLDNENKRWSANHYKKTLLVKLLEMCRGRFGKSNGYLVWNIIEIWKNVRGGLTGSDLSSLDLSNVMLNMVKCSRVYEDKPLAITFDHSLFNERNLLSQGHSSEVTSAVYSQDGKVILSASHDGTIKEWVAVTGECAKTYKSHSKDVNSAVYSQDGRRILSASRDNTIKEWDVVTGECIRIYQGHSSAINSAVYSQDGRQILSASRDNTIKEWDAVMGKCIRTYQGHSNYVNSAVYSQDGGRILSASRDNTIKEWDAVMGKCIRTYQGHSKGVNSAVYSQDGRRILSASRDNTIKEWDTVTGECIRTYKGHSNYVNSAVYSQDGKRILSASDDNNIKEWDAVTGECIRTYRGHSRDVNSAVYSQDGKRILSASRDNTIKEWDTVTSECIRTYQGYYHDVYSVVCGQECKRILTASRDNTIKEWDAVTGECIRTYQGHYYDVNSAVYSQDGKRILSASGDNTIKEWDAVTGKYIRTYQGHSSYVSSAVYSQDGKRILSTSWDETIKEWDIVTGKCIGTYRGHYYDVNSAVYSQDDKWILSAWDIIIKEWDAVTGKCIRIYQGHSNYINSVVYSQNGKRILSASRDNTVKEWDAVTGECIRTYQGHSRDVNSAVYSQDGKVILSASNDGTVKEWDAVTGKCIRTLENVPGLMIYGCTFKNLHSDSIISDQCKKVLKLYGAVFD